MKILIVDDSSLTRRVLAYVNEKDCHFIIEAEAGKDGLEKAAMHLPDLIISDILMPVMGGFQFLKHIKENNTLRSIPFIFYSEVYTGDKEKEFALSLGVLAFINRSQEPDAVWSEIKTILESVKGIFFEK
jgi:CheY-like chemotaxis protein